MSNNAAVAQKDRRTSNRLVSRSKFRCRLKRATEEGTWMATVRNISAEGIGLLANRPFRSGMTLTLELPTSATQVAKTVLVRVTHCRHQSGTKYWVLGGAFSRELTKEELDFLRARTPLILPQSERRTRPRHTTKLKNPVPVIRVAEEGPWFATIRNVSDRGISLIIDRPFRADVLLTIELPDRTGKFAKPRLMRVKHARPQPGNKWWVLGGSFLSRLTAQELAELV
jgi:hypothetical protein